MRLWRKEDTKQRLSDWKSILNFGPREMAALLYTIFMEVSERQGFYPANIWRANDKHLLALRVHAS